MMSSVEVKLPVASWCQLQTSFCRVKRKHVCSIIFFIPIFPFLTFGGEWKDLKRSVHKRSTISHDFICFYMTIHINPHGHCFANLAQNYVLLATASKAGWPFDCLSIYSDMKHSRKRYKQSLNFKTSGNFEANWSNSKRYAPCVWTLDSVDASVSFCAYVFRMALSWFIGATEQRWRLLLAKIRWHTALRKLHNFLGVFFFCFIHLRSTPCRLGQSNYIWFNE